MKVQRIALGDVAFLLVLGIAIPIALVHVVYGTYHLALIAAIAVAIGVAIEVTGWNPWPTAVAAPELELMDRVPAPSEPITVRVVRASGTCPLGFRPGSWWTIDEAGHVSSPLCRPAVAALNPALGRSMETTGEGPVSCHCPLGDREVAFAFSRQ